MDGTMEGFLQWCRDQKEGAEQSLDFFERGMMTFHVNGRDVTQSDMEHLRQVIASMDAILAEHEARNA